MTTKISIQPSSTLQILFFFVHDNVMCYVCPKICTDFYSSSSSLLTHFSHEVYFGLTQASILLFRPPFFCEKQTALCSDRTRKAFVQASPLSPVHEPVVFLSPRQRRYNLKRLLSLSRPFFFVFSLHTYFSFHCAPAPPIPKK